MIPIESQVKLMIADISTNVEDFVNAEVRDKVLIPEISKIIEGTPIGVTDSEGSLRGSWEVVVGQRLSRIQKVDRSKGASYVKTALGGKSIFGKIVRFGNARIYAHVVQDGKYPKNPTLGTYNKYIKRYEIRSRRGYSKQAPRGMVNLNRIRRSIERKFL